MDDIKQIINAVQPEIALSLQFKTNKDIEALFHAYNTLAARSGRLELVEDDAPGADFIKYFNSLYEEDLKKVSFYYAEEIKELQSNETGRDSFSLFLKKMAVLLVFFVFAVLVLALAYSLVVSKTDPNAEVFKTVFEALSSIVKVFFGI